MQGLLGCMLVTPLDGSEALKARVLSMTDSVVQVKLRRKVPFTVVRMLAANVIRMESEECLIRRHPRSTTVEQLHGEVELRTLSKAGHTHRMETYHVTHRVVLETKFLGKVEEDILDFLSRHGYLTICRPCWIVLGGGEGGVRKGRYAGYTGVRVHRRVIATVENVRASIA